MEVLIVDDHQLIRSGLRDLIVQQLNDVNVIEAGSGAEAIELVSDRPVDIAVVDLFMPGESAFVFLRRLCDSYPELPVLVLSASENSAHVRKSIDLGACGYVAKSAPQQELVAAIETILAGGIHLPQQISQSPPVPMTTDETVAHINIEEVAAGLTERQLEILSMVAEGLSNKQIASVCNVTENTVKVHVSAILKSLGLSNRTQAGLLIQKLDFLSRPSEN